MKDFEIYLFGKVRKWANERGILPDKAENAARTKLCKVMEELGELAHAELRNDMGEVADAIGDTLVTLIIYAEHKGLWAEECLMDAFEVISKRTGKMVNGTFVRDKEIA